MYITGGAGVGKSHLLRELIRQLPTSTTVVTASTGIAACQIGGVTIHHWSGVCSVERSIEQLAPLIRVRRGAQWRAAKVLIIDELSMLDGRLFDLLEAVARRIRGVDAPFGGLQCVLLHLLIAPSPSPNEPNTYAKVGPDTDAGEFRGSG